MRFSPQLGLGFFCFLWVLNGCRTAPGWLWERADAGLPRQVVILALAAHPDDPNKLWAGYYAPGGLATSHDGGQTWITNAKGLGDNPIFDLLFVPDNTLWAATRDGLMKSTDGGTNWELIAPTDLPSPAAFALASDASGQVYVGFDDGGLLTGEPDGDRWESLVHSESLSTPAVLSLVVSPDGRYLYAGTAGHGIHSSQDAGHSWTAAFPGNYVPNVVLNPSHSMTAVASLRNGLVRTDDGGQSWETLSTSWTRDEVVSLLWLEDPVSGSPSLRERDGILLAGSGKGQVYCSRDEGESWNEMGAGVPGQGGVLALAAAANRLLAGTWTGVYAGPLLPASGNGAGEKGCGDASQSWTYLSSSLGFPNANTVLAADGGLLIGTRAGLFRWQPAARRWDKVPLPDSTGRDSPSGGVAALAAAPPDGKVQIAYAGATGGELYRSDDGGENWARVPSDLKIGTQALSITPEDVDHIYMLAAWERMYESSDGGHNWQARWTGLGITTEAISLAIDPVNPSTIYLGTDTGLYRSLYMGQDWRAVGHRLDDQTVLTLSARPDPSSEAGRSILYIGATRGAYRSYDGGDTVELWGRGLKDLAVTAILFDPIQPWTVYVGTAYAGLYLSVDEGETWQPTGPPALAQEVVEAMAWGPAGELFVASAGSVWMGSKE